MKKTLLVAALAAMLLFAFAGSALAVGINHSGQTGLGAKGTVPTAEPGKSTAGIYLAWTTTLGSNAPMATRRTATTRRQPLSVSCATRSTMPLLAVPRWAPARPLTPCCA